jgi:hypothetical protein
VRHWWKSSISAWIASALALMPVDRLTSKLPMVGIVPLHA